jgi:hypothetical protein
MSFLESATNFAGEAIGAVGDGFNSLTSNAFSGALAETYRPKNSFSFQFAPKQSGKISGSLSSLSSLPEYFMTVGPSQYSETYNPRISHEPLFGGNTAVVDMGTGNNEIRIDGEFHIYHIQLPSSTRQNVSGGGVVAAAKSTASSFASNYYDKIRNNFLNFSGGDMRSGFQEFFDLCYFLHYSMIKNFEYESQDQTAKLITNSVPDFGRNHYNTGIVFRDYDRDRHVEVIIPTGGFMISRSIQDTNTYKYSIRMIVVKELGETLKAPLVRSNMNPSFQLAALMNEIDTLINLPLVASGALVASARFLDNAISSLRSIPDTFGRMRNQVKADGKLARKTFQNSIDQVKNAFGFGRKKNLNPEEISRQIDSAFRQSKYIESQFRQQLAQAESNLSALLSVIGIYTVGTSGGSLESESLKPDADLTDWVDNEIYSWTMNALEVIIQIQAELQYASVDSNYNIYNINSGDSYEKIAERVLGNRELAGALALWNNDELRQEISRQAIRIPFGTDTGIVSSLPEEPTPRDLEVALIGTDIKLTENRDVDISPNGDLGIIQGDESLVNNILDLIDTPQESWTLYPELGNPIPIGEVDDLANSGYLRDILRQIQSDARVKSASLGRVIQNGDKYLILIDIQSVSGGSYFITL